MVEKAKQIVEELSFDECKKLYEDVSGVSPIIEIIFNRMEKIDPVRFDKWFKGEE